jgi:hypothetical protein
MATSYKNIVITPNTGNTSDPKIVFSGANTTVNTDITMYTYPTSGGTLSFEGSAGQLFSINNSLTGSIFSVNDVSGIPSIEVLDTGVVKLAQYGGNVGIGTGSPSTSLDVAGTIRSTVQTAPSSGAGLELYYTGGMGYLNSYDRTASTWSALNIRGSQVYLYANGNLAMTVLASGNTGIGTVAPAGKLEVAGGQVVVSNYAANAGMSLRSANGTQASPTQISAATILYSINGAGRDDASGYQIVSEMRSVSDGAITSTSSPGYLTFRTTASGAVVTTERMRILSSGQLLVGGNATSLTAIPGSLGNSTIYSRAGMTVVNDTTTLGYFQSYDSNATTDLKTWRHGGQDNGSYIFQTVNDAYNSSTTRLTISATGILSDGKGDVRAAPIQTKSGAYVAVASDAGQTIYISTGGVTINASILSAGDMITIVNNSASPQTITAGASVTFRLAGTATTGNRTLAQYGMATFLCVVGGATPTLHCSGAGLT